MYPKLVAGFAGVCLRITAPLLLVLLFGGCSLSGETPSPVATPVTPTLAAPTVTMSPSATTVDSATTTTPPSEDPIATATLASRPTDSSSAAPTSPPADPPTS